MKDIYQHKKHNKNLLMVHIILVTKYWKNYSSDISRNL